jgi:hypothetical protein
MCHGFFICSGPPSAINCICISPREQRCYYSRLKHVPGVKLLVSLLIRAPHHPGNKLLCEWWGLSVAEAPPASVNIINITKITVDRHSLIDIVSLIINKS